jgi:hypothetical protein
MLSFAFYVNMAVVDVVEGRCGCAALHGGAVACAFNMQVALMTANYEEER